MNFSILSLDGDPALMPWLTKLLRDEGYQIKTMHTVQRAMDALKTEAFDLFLLDLVLPDGDGLACCRQIRKASNAPIVILSAKDDLDLKVMGFDAGADDYVVKPCHPRELLARIRAQLRRTHEFNRAFRSNVRMIAVGDIVIDQSAHDAIVNGEPAGLTNKEFKLLEFLAKNPGRAYSKERIFEHVWGEDAELAGKTLVVHVRRLREKICSDPDNPRHLLTVRGYGYKLSL